MNPDYIAKWVDLHDPSTLYLNASFKMFDLINDEEGENQSEKINNLCARYAKRNCRRCHGRGFQIWDQNGAEKYFVVCNCGQRKFEKETDAVAL